MKLEIVVTRAVGIAGGVVAAALVAMQLEIGLVGGVVTAALMAVTLDLGLVVLDLVRHFVASCSLGA
jgi:hypothetical protein